MPPRKQKPIWNVALTYYITANLIAFIPIVLVGLLIGKITTQAWQVFILTLVFDALGTAFAFRFSANNITKHYIVLDKKKIVQWSIGYLLFFHTLFLIFSFITAGVSLQFILTLLLVVEMALINYFIVSEFQSFNPNIKKPPRGWPEG